MNLEEQEMSTNNLILDIEIITQAKQKKIIEKSLCLLILIQAVFVLLILEIKHRLIWNR